MNDGIRLFNKKEMYILGLTKLGYSFFFSQTKICSEFKELFQNTYFFFIKLQDFLLFFSLKKENNSFYLLVRLYDIYIIQ